MNDWSDERKIEHLTAVNKQLEQKLEQIKELVDANDYRYSKAGLLQEEIQQILEGDS